jgi:hypothetical protein
MGRGAVEKYWLMGLGNNRPLLNVFYLATSSPMAPTRIFSRVIFTLENMRRLSLKSKIRLSLRDADPRQLTIS